MRKNISRKIPYNCENFSVLVPEQMSMLEIRCKNEGADKLPPIQGFTVIREIGSFDIIDINGDNLPEQFELPLEFRVGYTEADAEEAEGYNNLLLAYYEDQKGRIITEKDNEYIIFPKESVKLAEFKIWSSSGDPTLVWGK